jgi:hypothetical protein
MSLRRQRVPAASAASSHTPRCCARSTSASSRATRGRPLLAVVAPASRRAVVPRSTRGAAAHLRLPPRRGHHVATRRVPLRVVAMRLGHSVETLVSTYVGVLEGDEAIANERIEAALDATPKLVAVPDPVDVDDELAG